MGLFSGSRPSNLGFSGGRFAPPSWKPNNVSSTAERSDSAHFVDPIAFTGDAGPAWRRLVDAVKAQPGATVITEQPYYLHAQFSSAVMGFVDDGEFALDAGAKVIHVRSGARLGIRDFGVNRARIEKIRGAFAAG